MVFTGNRSQELPPSELGVSASSIASRQPERERAVPGRRVPPGRGWNPARCFTCGCPETPRKRLALHWASSVLILRVLPAPPKRTEAGDSLGETCSLSPKASILSEVICFAGTLQFSWLSRVRLFVTPWSAAHQASLSIPNPRNLLKLMSIESVTPSSHLILCRPLFLLPSILPSIRVFSNESTLCIR